jgi:hypothetical protein
LKPSTGGSPHALLHPSRRLTYSAKLANVAYLSNQASGKRKEESLEVRADDNDLRFIAESCIYLDNAYVITPQTYEEIDAERQMVLRDFNGKLEEIQMSFGGSRPIGKNDTTRKSSHSLRTGTRRGKRSNPNNKKNKKNVKK